MSEFSIEVRTAIDAAVISLRESDEDGPRVMVMSPALRAFIFSRKEAARRIRLAWPELSDRAVVRAVRYLESRAALAARPAVRARKSNWVHGWAE